MIAHTPTSGDKPAASTARSSTRSTVGALVGLWFSLMGQPRQPAGTAQHDRVRQVATETADHAGIISVMEAVVMHPGCPLLPASRSACLRRDVVHFQFSSTAQARYLWLIGQDTSRLLPLGVTEELNQSALRCAESSMNALVPPQLHHLSSRGVERVTLETVRTLADRFSYAVRRGAVLGAGNRPIARFSIEPLRGAAREYSALRFKAASRPSRADMAALLHISTSLLARSWRSLFAMPGVVRLDGEDLFELMNRVNPAGDEYAA